MKLEFSKIWLIMCGAITFLCCAVSYILAFCGLDTVQDLSIALVQTLLAVDGASFAGYIFQNSVRAFSEDKYGRPNNDGYAFEEDDSDDN